MLENIEFKDIANKIEYLERFYSDIISIFKSQEKQQRLIELEKETSKDGFWNDQRLAGKVVKEINEIKKNISELEKAKKENKKRIFQIKEGQYHFCILVNIPISLLTNHLSFLILYIFNY